MAQTRKTFFDLGQAERIADPREEELARRRALEIEEARRQDALRAAIEGESIQREQLAQSQQQSMDKLGLDRARMGLDREKFGQQMLLDRDRMAAAQEEAQAGRAHGLTLREMIEGGLDSRQAGQFQQQQGLQESLFEQQSREGLARDQSAMDRVGVQDATRRQLSQDSLAQALQLSNAETARQDSRADQAEAVRLSEREERISRETEKDFLREEMQRRSLESAERQHQETMGARNAKTAEDSAYRTSRDQARLDAVKDDRTYQEGRESAATKAAARDQITKVLEFSNDFTESEVLQELRYLSQTNPSAKALIQGEFKDLLKKRLQEDQSKVGVVSDAFRSAGHVLSSPWGLLTGDGVYSPSQKRASERDTLRRILGEIPAK